jgi:peptidoglycan/xylan/chitin deacetylase (PgdA/CDA1 family)
VTYRVLAYHTVGRYDALLPSGIGLSPEAFAAHLDHLAGRVVPLEAALAGRGIAITFDDGYADNLAHAVPELARRGMPATFFVTAGLVDGRMPLDHRTLPMVSAAELRTLAAAPGIEIGSHALTHRSLAGAAFAELERELFGSRARLEELTGKPVRWLSWPFGACDAAACEAARRAGYTAAFSVWTRQEGPFARLRIPIHTADGTWRLAAKLSPFYFPLKRLLRA